MQGANFILFITDEIGWSYYVDTMGAVQKIFSPKPLNTVPSNFEEMQLKWGRSETYAGLQQTYTVSGQFVKDAAKIIRHIMYTKGSEGVISLRIYKLNKQFGAGLKQELFYESEFDLSKYTRETDFVSALLKEGGAEKLLRAFENTDYEIDVTDDPEAVDVLNDGILTKNTFNYKVAPVIAEMFVSGGIASTESYYLPVTFLNKEGITSVDILTASSAYSLVSGALADSFNWFLTLPPWFTFKLKGSVKFAFTSGVDAGSVNRDFGFTIEDSNGQVYFTEPVTTRVLNQVYEVNFDLDITTLILIIKEARFFIIGECTVFPRKVTTFKFYETDITVKFDYRQKPVITKALPALVLLKRILTKIFGYEPVISSNLLTDGTDIVYTCGDEIRKLPSSKIKTSFSKFFEFNHMLYCVGFDLLKDANGKAIAIFEKRSDFYKDEQIVDITTVANFTDSFSDDLLFNEIIIGYPDQDYGEVNGRGEFNVTQKYTTPITKTVKQLTLQTQYRADMIGIEITRTNLQNKTTTDSNSDNDVFVFNIEKTLTTDVAFSPDPYYKFDRSVNASATGLLHAPSAFNIKLSPHTCLLAHGWYLRSCLFYHAAGKIILQTSDKNAALVYTDNNGNVITERGDINIGLLPAPLFSPFVFNITTSVPNNMIELMSPKPKGFIQFKANGFTWKGFILDAGTKPVTKEEQTWKLLSKADNDLTRLI